MSVIGDRGDSAGAEPRAELCRVELLMAQVFTGVGSVRAVVDLAVAEFLDRLRTDPGFTAAVRAALARRTGVEPFRATEPGALEPTLEEGRQEDDGGQGRVLPRDRALACARVHVRRVGSFPSCRQLARLAEVSCGTAQRALRQLRDS
jgi:hypothetical protein